jgi:hypothetical protein
MVLVTDGVGGGTGRVAGTVESATGVGEAMVGSDLEIAVMVATGGVIAEESVGSC